MIGFSHSCLIWLWKIETFTECCPVRSLFATFSADFRVSQWEKMDLLNNCDSVNHGKSGCKI